MKKILSAFLVLLMCFTLIGCDSSAQGTPSETVDSMLKDFKNQNFDKLSNYFDGKINLEKTVTMSGNISSADKQVKNSFLNKITDIDYEILDETISEDGKKATVIVKITSHNIAEKLLEGVSATLPNIVKITMSGKSAEEITKELFNSVFSPLENTEKKVINSINVKLVSKDGKWKLSVLNTEFLSSITGGLMDVIGKFDFLMK